MKARTFILTTLLLTQISFAQTAPLTTLMGQDRGGGRPVEIVESEMKLLIQGNSLKNAILKYLETMIVQNIQDPEVKLLFSNLLANNSLQNDINTKDNYAIRESCRDSYNQAVPASTQIGIVGAEICFDLKALALEYQNLSSEEVIIRLAALALHEHIHHFQEPTRGLKFNEDQAYHLSAYVLVTAKIAQVPVLKWDPNPVEQKDRIRLENGVFESPYSDDWYIGCFYRVVVNEADPEIYLWRQNPNSHKTPRYRETSYSGCADGSDPQVYKKGRNSNEYIIRHWTQVISQKVYEECLPNEKNPAPCSSFYYTNGNLNFQVGDEHYSESVLQVMNGKAFKKFTRYTRIPTDGSKIIEIIKAQPEFFNKP